MARPRHCRFVQQPPKATYFKPCGVPLHFKDELKLSVEGLEALRLSDIEGLSAQDAADHLRVSRYTYGRTLAEARRIVAEALVLGKTLRIEGGDYAIAEKSFWEKGKECAPLPQEETLLAISSEGPSLDDNVDPRYGRAGGFVLVSLPCEPKQPEVRYLDNGDAQVLPTEAGIATTENLRRAGVRIVLSGFVGPMAFDALQKAGITVYQNMEGQTVREALVACLDGRCQPAEAPNHKAGNAPETSG